MPKIVALDFGLKRIGVAITDDLNIIASGLDTVMTQEIIPFLKDLNKVPSLQPISRIRSSSEILIFF